MLTNLNSLTSKELKRFSEFIRSPYFNKSSAIIKLFDYLEKKYPSIMAEDVKKEKISRHIFDNVIVNDVRIRKVESDFNILFEKFLLHEDLENSKTEAQILLLKNLRLKALNETREKKIDEIMNFSEDDFGRNDSYYLNKIFFYVELKFYSHTGNIKSPSSEIMKWLHLYFIFQCLLQNLSSNRVTPEIGTMVDDIYSYVEKNKKYFLKYHPFIIIVYYANRLQDSFNKEDLHFMENYYSENHDRINVEQQKFYYHMIYRALYSECLINPSLHNYTKFHEFLDILVEEDDLKMFFRIGSKYQPQEQYFTCFNTLVNFCEFEKAEKFAADYLQYIFPDKQEKMTNLVQLILSFFRKDLTDTSNRLNDVKKDNMKIYVQTRYIKLMLLYELKQYETLEYEIQSLSKNLNRMRNSKTLTEPEITRGKNFVKMITLLYGVKEGKESLRSKRATELEDMLRSEDYVQEYAFWVEGEMRDL